MSRRSSDDRFPPLDSFVIKGSTEDENPYILVSRNLADVTDDAEGGVSNTILTALRSIPLTIVFKDRPVAAMPADSKFAAIEISSYCRWLMLFFARRAVQLGIPMKKWSLKLSYESERTHDRSLVVSISGKGDSAKFQCLKAPKPVTTTSKKTEDCAGFILEVSIEGDGDSLAVFDQRISISFTRVDEAKLPAAYRQGKFWNVDFRLPLTSYYVATAGSSRMLTGTMAVAKESKAGNDVYVLSTSGLTLATIK